ncbi:MAG: ArsB/NhaD family transporter [Acidimicrobiia bacterium]
MIFVIAVSLLVIGTVLVFVRPVGVPLWVGPSVAAVVGLASGTVAWSAARENLELLRAPLAFVALAVPLAVLLDRIGVFTALAAFVDGGRHLAAYLWVLAATVTIVFNLDAAVVLLTPLYIRVAVRHGYPPETLAFQPAMLACLASNPLPVSNLTNLIAAEHFDLHAGDFVAHLALPTLAACAVGWLAFRTTFPLEPHAPGIDEPVDTRALRRGLPIVGSVLVGFTVGDAIGIEAWMVAAVAVVWAALLVREIPWRAVPYEAVFVAASLAVLVAGAVGHLGLEHLLHGSGIAGRARAFAFGAVGSNASNNLPALLAALPSVDRGQVWALLIGANVGPSLVLTGALSGLLWRDTARRLDVEVSARRYSTVGLRVGLPALLAAGTAVILVG